MHTAPVLSNTASTKRFPSAKAAAEKSVKPVIHSIWERGSDADIKALIREVKVNPEAADAVRRAIPHSTVYGFPRFFELYLENVTLIDHTTGPSLKVLLENRF